MIGRGGRYQGTTPRSLRLAVDTPIALWSRSKAAGGAPGLGAPRTSLRCVKAKRSGAWDGAECEKEWDLNRKHTDHTFRRNFRVSVFVVPPRSWIGRQALRALIEARKQTKTEAGGAGINWA